jgi:hypothetical protein
MKMAVALGSLVAGKKLNLGPGALAELARQQLRDNPQFKEIGDQLRQDLRGVGQAASGAMVERRMGSLADRLHDRTARLRGELSSAAPGSGEEPDEDESAAARDEDESGDRGSEDHEDARESGGEGEDREDRRARRDEPSGRKPAKDAAKKAAKKAPPKKTPGQKAAGKRTAPAKAAAKRTGAAGRSAVQAAGARGSGSRQSKGGDDR